MPLKPRFVLVTLLGASAVGVHLTWTGATAPLVVPLASWTAIVSMGTLFAGSLLWQTYVDHSDGPERPQWLVRRWRRLCRLSLVGTIGGLTVRWFSTTGPVTWDGLVPIGVAAGLACLAATTAGIYRFDPARDYPKGPLLIAGSAGVGLVIVAWVDVQIAGGSVGESVVRVVHLVAVGAWIGGAVWHNVLVVPALTGDERVAVRPVVRRFQRFVPLFVVAILGSGLYQAITWLGPAVSTYVSTNVGRLVVLKLAVLVVLTLLVIVTRLRNLSTRTSNS